MLNRPRFSTSDQRVLSIAWVHASALPKNEMNPLAHALFLRFAALLLESCSPNVMVVAVGRTGCSKRGGRIRARRRWPGPPAFLSRRSMTPTKRIRLAQPY
ncbi:MAG TPA: hypothetical protein VK404_15730 [Spirosoma sp.]|nr:hypothetical protein [Spirosoma sp.]